MCKSEDVELEVELNEIDVELPFCSLRSGRGESCFWARAWVAARLEDEHRTPISHQFWIALYAVMNVSILEAPILQKKREGAAAA